MEFVVDENGERTRVILDYEEYLRLLDAVEDHEDAEHIQAARETLARVRRGEGEVIPWEEVRDKIGSEYEGS